MHTLSLCNRSIFTYFMMTFVVSRNKGSVRHLSFFSLLSDYSHSRSFQRRQTSGQDCYCWIAFISNSIHTIHCILEAHSHQVLNNFMHGQMSATAFVESNANADCKWKYCFIIWHSRKCCVLYDHRCVIFGSGSKWGEERGDVRVLSTFCSKNKTKKSQ